MVAQTQKQRSDAYYRRHRIRILSTRKLDNTKFRQEAMEKYGGACVRCGIDDHRVLCFDHVNDDGAQMKRDGVHPSGRGFYRWLKTNRWPKFVQLLCHNCNVLKQHYPGEF